MNLLATPMFGLAPDGRGIYIFGFEVYFYALVIVTGMILATVLSALLMKRRNISPDFVFTLFVVCIPSALICARLYYCITDGMHVSEWFAWDSIRKGGMSILGGVIGGVGAGLIVCIVKKVNFLRFVDCVVMNILLAQAIGRWGNYFNNEVYGALITDPAQQWFPWAVQINGSWYQALFFYESVLNTVGFLLLFAAAWFYARKPSGILGCLYFVWYGAVRTFMEPMRNPSYILGSQNDIMWSQLTSILMMVAGLVGIAVLLILNYKKEGSLIGSKKGDPCAITSYIPVNKEDVPYFSKINMMGHLYPTKTEEGEAEKSQDGEAEE